MDLHLLLLYRYFGMEHHKFKSEAVIMLWDECLLDKWKHDVLTFVPCIFYYMSNEQTNAHLIDSLLFFIYLSYM